MKGYLPKSLTLKIVKMMQRQCGGWKITIHLFRVLKQARQTVNLLVGNL